MALKLRDKSAGVGRPEVVRGLLRSQTKVGITKRIVRVHSRVNVELPRVRVTQGFLTRQQVSQLSSELKGRPYLSPSDKLLLLALSESEEDLRRGRAPKTR